MSQLLGQEALEIFRNSFPSILVNQEVTEVFWKAIPPVRTSQQVAEVMYRSNSGYPRVSQLVVEVLRSFRDVSAPSNLVLMSGGLALGGTGLAAFVQVYVVSGCSLGGSAVVGLVLNPAPPVVITPSSPRLVCPKRNFFRCTVHVGLSGRQITCALMRREKSAYIAACTICSQNLFRGTVLPSIL